MGKSSSVRRSAGIAITVVSAFAIAALTLTPQPTASGAALGRWCVVCGTASVADMGANVLLFLPLGVGLTLAGVSWWRATLVAALFSTCIEATQYLAVPGRFATASDVLTNTLGGLLGGLVTAFRWFWLRPRPGVARGLAVTSAAFFVGSLGASAWLLSRPNDDVPWTPAARPLPPPMPNGATSYGGWFSGHVRQARLGDFTVRHAGTGPVTISAPARRVVQAEAIVVGRDPRPTLIPMLYVVSSLHPRSPWLVVGQHGTRYELEVGHRARTLGLRQPNVSIRRSVEWRSRRRLPLILRATLSGDRLTLEFFQGAEHRRSTVRLAPTFGWALISPIPSVDAPEAALATAAWVATLSMPIGYFSACLGGAAGARRRSAAVEAAVIVAIALVGGLAAVPLWKGFAIARPFEWGAALGGVLAGAALSATLRRIR